MAKMYRVYSVIARPRQEDFWLNIGMAYAHEKGDGFNVVLQAPPLHGKLLLWTYEPEQRLEAEPGEAATG